MKRILLITLMLLLTLSIVYAGSQARSSKTANSVITEVRYKLNETSAVTPWFWTDTELLQWVDEGIKDLVARTHCLQGTATIVLSTNAMSYTWSGTSPYVAIEDRVFYLNHSSGKYKKLTRNDKVIGKVFDAGPPEYWYEHNNRIWIWPVAVTPYSGSTVYVDYTAMPVGVISSTSPIETPAVYDAALVWYVAAQAKIKQGRYDEAQYFTQKYETECDRFRADFIIKPKESLEEAGPK